VAQVLKFTGKAAEALVTEWAVSPMYVPKQDSSIPVTRGVILKFKNEAGNEMVWIIDGHKLDGVMNSLYDAYMASMQLQRDSEGDN
jgi:hypothetical protein